MPRLKEKENKSVILIENMNIMGQYYLVLDMKKRMDVLPITCVCLLYCKKVFIIKAGISQNIEMTLK